MAFEQTGTEGGQTHISSSLGQRQHMGDLRSGRQMVGTAITARSPLVLKTLSFMFYSCWLSQFVFLLYFGKLILPFLNNNTL